MDLLILVILRELQADLGLACTTHSVEQKNPVSLTRGSLCEEETVQAIQIHLTSGELWTRAWARLECSLRNVMG